VKKTLIYYKMRKTKNNKSLHMTANSSAVFEMLYPVSKQVVIQGSGLRSVGGR